MIPNRMFINGCSFLTTRPRRGVHTHTGQELAKLMNLEVACQMANGGRGHKRLYWTTRAWCEKFPEQAEKCFFQDEGLTVNHNEDHLLTTPCNLHLALASTTAIATTTTATTTATPTAIAAAAAASVNSGAAGTDGALGEMQIL